MLPYFKSPTLVVLLSLVSFLLVEQAVSERVVVCENDGVTIECNPGNLIDVKSGRYGAPAPEKCLHRSVSPGPPDNHRPVRCQHPDSIDLLKSMCQNKEKCHVKATNDVFRDPCRGTPKVLEFVYVCVEDSKENEADVP